MITYKNGLYLGESSLAYYPVESTTTFRIGYSYTGYLQGKLNDFRIYDNILSAKEIYLISQAKVLHYTFNNENEEPAINEFNSTSLMLGNYGGDGVLQSSEQDPFGGTLYPVYRKEGKIRFGVSNGNDVGTLYYGSTYTFSIYLRKVLGTTEPTSMEFDICDISDTTNFNISALTYE